MNDPDINKLLRTIKRSKPGKSSHHRYNDLQHHGNQAAAASNMASTPVRSAVENLSSSSLSSLQSLRLQKEPVKLVKPTKSDKISTSKHLKNHNNNNINGIYLF